MANRKACVCVCVCGHVDPLFRVLFSVTQLKWVIQMSTSDKQDFAGEWTSGVKQVTLLVLGVLLFHRW